MKAGVLPEGMAACETYFSYHLCPFCRCMCMSTDVHTCVYAYAYAYGSACTRVYPNAYKFVYANGHMSIHLPMHMFMHMPTCLSGRMPKCLIHIPIHMYTHRSMHGLFTFYTQDQPDRVILTMSGGFIDSCKKVWACV